MTRYWVFVSIKLGYYSEEESEGVHGKEKFRR